MDWASVRISSEDRQAFEAARASLTTRRPCGSAAAPRAPKPFSLASELKCQPLLTRADTEAKLLVLGVSQTLAEALDSSTHEWSHKEFATAVAAAVGSSNPLATARSMAKDLEQ